MVCLYTACRNWDTVATWAPTYAHTIWYSRTAAVQCTHTSEGITFTELTLISRYIRSPRQIRPWKWSRGVSVVPLQGHLLPQSGACLPSSIVSSSLSSIGEGVCALIYRYIYANNNLVSVSKVNDQYYESAMAEWVKSLLTICSIYSFPAWITSTARFFCSWSRSNLYALSTAMAKEKKHAWCVWTFLPFFCLYTVILFFFFFWTFVTFKFLWAC